MRVLRENKDSAMAMLEAFVHDPLINWRLLNTASPRQRAGTQPDGLASRLQLDMATPASPSHSPTPSRFERELPLHVDNDNAQDKTEMLNQKAVEVCVGIYSW